jgi:hypothetical protein
MNPVVAMQKLRESCVIAEHGGMTDELLEEIETLAAVLFTPEVKRLVKALTADARHWRRLKGST